MFQQALLFHQQGQLTQAQTLYENILTYLPRHVDCLHLLGVIAHQTNKHKRAVELIAKAIEINPDISEFYLNIGSAQRALQQLDAALSSYEKAIALKPYNADAYYNRGNVLKELNRLDDALASYDKALTLKSDYEVYINRGNVLLDLKRREDALTSYDKALILKPNCAEAYLNRGKALKDLNRLDDALVSYDKAMVLKPDCDEAYNFRGNVLLDLVRLDDALASYEQSIALKPYSADAYCNRGNALRALKRLDDALASYDKALALEPDCAEAYCNRGNTLTDLGHLDAAIAEYDRVIATKPDYSDAYWNKSLTLLLSGDFDKGWELYEWRWLRGKTVSHNRYAAKPLWLGVESLKGKTILLHSEQGLGDTIQFCRYATLVAQLGATVLLEVQLPLLELLRGLERVCQVVAEGATLPPFDYHCPSMSLPLAFKTTIGTIPADIPYIKADPSKVAYWRTKLGEHTKLRVGLVWNGGFRPNQPEVWVVNERRNIPLELISRINTSEIDFYSLQKGEPAESELLRRKQEVWPETNLFNFANELRDFSDTAALIENLDLVISVDTSTAHLAAAMGKPTWILNRYDSCWRWLLDRDDSPWYPTVKLYRQQRLGDWESVLERVNTDLSKGRITGA
jgi:tetratricopeptide (TPR) repeat protein